MDGFDKPNRLIEEEAPLFTQRVNAAARTSHDEAEFRSEVFKIIEAVAGKLGVDLLVHEEYTLATGRADAVYNRLIVEYEPPGSLRPDLAHGRTKHAVKQVQDYIQGIAKRERHEVDRLLGVAFDGSYYIFVRYRNGHWYIDPPLEVTPTATTHFLRALVSLSSGRALIPENLVDDFGHQNLYSQRVARALYYALDGHVGDLTAKLFAQWQLFFSEVSGYEEATAKLRDKPELRQFARGMGLKPEQTDPPRLFFAIHTYFSFLVKAIARLVLERYAGGSFLTTPLTVLASLEGDALRHELEKLENGGIFRALGIQNLLEGDFFGWYLNAWTPDVEAAIRLTLSRLAEYNPATIEEDPYAARDLLKKLYHYLMPRELRHDLGEYYTPDWLAERVLTQLNEPLYQMPNPGVVSRRLDVNKRLLDPACGSGTFLILAIRALKEHCQRQGLGETATLEIILNNIVGIDLNPLAVMAARVNYLLAIADLVPNRRSPIDIPVYLADSILTPAEGKDLWERGRLILRTVVGDLPIPGGIDTREEMEKLTTLLEECVEQTLPADAFIQRTKSAIGMPWGSTGELILRELYEKLHTLERQGLNRIWARILKNAFMPLFAGQFDYVIGNPPWVNWESLPEAYRAASVGTWHRYGFVPPGGLRSILGESKMDISTLMAYVAIDRFLKSGGKLAFVITQSVFKTAGAAGSFRQFRLQDRTPLRVIHVDDMSELQPFEGASNRTAVVVVQKGFPTRYPVPYTYWRKIARGKGLSYESSLEEVVAMTARLRFTAMPVDRTDITSPWLSGRPRALRAVQKVLGKADYEAHAGVYSGGTNAVYWLEIVAKRPDGPLTVRNITEGTKRDVESITAEIEPDLVYPLLRGRSIRRWSAVSAEHVLVTRLQGMHEKTFPEHEMQGRYPLAYRYLKRFEVVLRERRDSVLRRAMKQGTPSYAMVINDYHFAPYKVVWPWISRGIRAAVVGCVAGKVVVPEHNTSFIPCQTAQEAHFLCALLNSKPGHFALRSFYSGGGGGIASPGALEHVRIPKFNVRSREHKNLARLSAQAHEIASQEGEILKAVEEKIDVFAAELWGITAGELKEIEHGLEEFSNGREPAATHSAAKEEKSVAVKGVDD